MAFRYWVGAFGFLVVIAVIGVITLTSRPVDADHPSEIAALLAWSHQHGLPHWFGYRQLEFTANIVMFAPLGFFAGLIAGRRWWVAALALPLLSVSIEAVQLMFLTGRFATGSDILANSLGGWAGLALAAVVMSKKRQSADRER